MKKEMNELTTLVSGAIQAEDKLLHGINWDMVNTVLVPFAGNGDFVQKIADIYRTKRLYHEKLKIDCLERSQKNKNVLVGKFSEERIRALHEQKNGLDEKKYSHSNRGESRTLTEEESREYRELELAIQSLENVIVHIVHDNFTTFHTRKKYDLILLNLLSTSVDGEVQLLKAIQMQSKYGGTIRSLLNADCLLNPCTSQRVAIKNRLIELGAEINFIEGNKAERVALVTINIPAPQRKSEFYKRFSQTAGEDCPVVDEIENPEISARIRQSVAQYNQEIDVGLEFIQEYLALRPLLKNDFDGKGCLLELYVGDLNEIADGYQFIKKVRMKYWRALFTKHEFVGHLTSNLQKKYANMVEKMIDYDFSLYNIKQIMDQMKREMMIGLQETILTLFDKFSSDHAWYPETKNNIHYYNGWQTNQVHKVNEKVIMPIGTGVFSQYSHETFNVSAAQYIIEDIEKVFNYLDGQRTADVDLRAALEKACMEGRTRNIACKYFSVSLFKKGTMHIKFLDKALLDRFNIYVARNRNWLPPSYGKEKYSHLNSEERQVVDSFQGEKAYGAVMDNQTFYLSNSVGMQLQALGPAVTNGES